MERAEKSIKPNMPIHPPHQKEAYSHPSPPTPTEKEMIASDNGVEAEILHGAPSTDVETTEVVGELTACNSSNAGPSSSAMKQLG